MELRAAREMRRNARIDKVLGKKAEKPGAPAQAQAPQPREPSDKLSLSQQALAYVEEQNRNLWQREEGQGGGQDPFQGCLDALETQKKSLDFMDEALDMMNKCLKIAAAIMRGDRVPPEDLRYLMEHDKEGYKMAMAMRRPKKDPKDVESVLDEEDRNGGGSQENGGAGESPSVEAGGGAQAGGGSETGGSR